MLVRDTHPRHSTLRDDSCDLLRDDSHDLFEMTGVTSRDDSCATSRYGVATVSNIDYIIGLFCRIQSRL